MPEAIVYISGTGFTARYAELLGARTGLPALALAQAGAYRGRPVIFLTWVRGTALCRLKEAQAQFSLRALLAVGMNYYHPQVLSELRAASGLGEDLPLFYAQGGFDKKKLRGMDRIMLTVGLSSMKGALLKKSPLSPEERDMLSLIEEGGSRVDPKYLDPLLRWLEEEERGAQA